MPSSPTPSLKLVVDTNILFAAVIARSKTLDLIESEKFLLLSPEFSLGEMREHKEEILEKSGFDETELSLFISTLKGEIDFLPIKEYIKHFESAMDISVDPDDVDFFALSLSKGKIPIWSNDPHFKKQSEIKVFTTSELVKFLSESK